MARKDADDLKAPETGIAPEATPPDDELYRRMVDQVRDYAIFLIDGQGRIQTWNGGAERIMGYRPHEVIGGHFAMLFPKDAIKVGTPQRELETARALGSVEQEGWRVRQDGSRFWAQVATTALHDQQGRLTGFVKVIRDVTERRNMEDALQKSRTMFERLFETAPDAVVVVDKHGVIRKVNQQAEVIFGYMREEMMGNPVEMLMPGKYQKRHRQHRRGYFADPRARKMGIGLELFGRHRDGHEIPVDIMLNPIETPEGTWAFAVVRDITEQKRSDALIKELNSALRVQVEQLGIANRELESFSYSVSHDLRAPLRHILGFIDLLHGRDTSALDEKSQHYLEVISQAARKMGHLIDDLLAFSRMGRAEMMQGRIDFNTLVADVVQELAEDLKDRNIQWRIAPLPAVIGDAALLRQVMVNLISNALKFTRSRPLARIEIGTVEGPPDEYQFFVRDNGVGFDSRYVNKLFSLFQRLHSNEEFEGTGVGLAIVQRILSRHNGRVWAEAAVDQGATFWFTLPKDGRVVGEAAAAPGRTPAKK